MRRCKSSAASFLSSVLNDKMLNFSIATDCALKHVKYVQKFPFEKKRSKAKGMEISLRNETEGKVNIEGNEVTAVKSLPVRQIFLLFKIGKFAL